GKDAGDGDQADGAHVQGRYDAMRVPVDEVQDEGGGYGRVRARRARDEPDVAAARHEERETGADAGHGLIKLRCGRCRPRSGEAARRAFPPGPGTPPPPISPGRSVCSAPSRRGETSSPRTAFLSRSAGSVLSSTRYDRAEQVVLQGLADPDRVELAGAQLPDLGIVDQADAVDFRRLGLEPPGNQQLAFG